jgi:hypothetical protein
VKKLITDDLLCFVTVGKIHLFVQLRIPFDLKFSALKELPFQHLLAGATTGKTLVPILFMMVTCSTNILTYLELLSWLMIDNTLSCL